MSEWQPIATAPRRFDPPNGMDGGPSVLVWSPIRGVSKVHWESNSWWYTCHSGRADLSDAPTHWMPLPPPPESAT